MYAASTTAVHAIRTARGVRHVTTARWSRRRDTPTQPVLSRPVMTVVEPAEEVARAT